MAEPLSLPDVKAHLNIAESDTSYDGLLTAYIAAAREYVENRSDHVLVEREFTEYRASFGRYIELTKRPVGEVIEVGYTDADGAEQTYSDFVASVSPHPARIHPALNGWWPTIQSGSQIPVKYTAGYAAGEEPQSLLMAMKLLIGHWMLNRETVADGRLAEMPHGVDALCDQVRGALL